MKKATAMIFFIFSVVVAFCNFLIGETQYTLFVLPFFIALSIKENYSKYFELFGINAISVYLILTQEIYVGIMGLLVSSCIFFASGITLRKARIYVYIVTILCFFSSYFRTTETQSQILRAFMDSGIYLVCASCIYISFIDHIERYREIAERAHRIAKDAVNYSKGKPI